MCHLEWVDKTKTPLSAYTLADLVTSSHVRISRPVLRQITFEIPRPSHLFFCFFCFLVYIRTHFFC